MKSLTLIHGLNREGSLVEIDGPKLPYILADSLAGMSLTGLALNFLCEQNEVSLEGRFGL